MTGASPNFYIFKGQKFWKNKGDKNYKAWCEDVVVMAMQIKAWMMAILFNKWIYVQSRGYELSLTNGKLFVLDECNSHVAMNDVQQANVHPLLQFSCPNARWYTH
jgi:hypothetical protein